MTLFYDPKHRKPKAWIKIVFISIPIVVFIIIYFWGQSLSQKKQYQKSINSKKNIFNTN